MFRPVALLISVSVLGCSSPGALTFPDGSFNPRNPFVLCGTTTCTFPNPPRSTCPQGQQCAKTRCDAGVCEGICVDAAFGPLIAQCDSHDCCTFTCGGFVGSACPAALPKCGAPNECCDQAGPCSR